MSGLEEQCVAEAFAGNWIAPVGPHVNAFAQEFAALVGVDHAAALSSGTAARHLALMLAGVGAGDEVLVSTLTGGPLGAASVNPILYLGARPVLIDSEPQSWNMDPALLTETLARKARQGKLSKAVVLVHLYGQSADIAPIKAACARYGVALIEDAAEALGSHYQGRPPGTFSQAGIYSFNGNKIITTSGGGMLVSNDGAFIAHARKLATQARDDAPHYQHSEMALCAHFVIGYNYRLSNVLAGIGRGQLRVLEERVQARRRNFDYYQETLGTYQALRSCPKRPGGGTRAGLLVLPLTPTNLAQPVRICAWPSKPKISKLAPSGSQCIVSRSLPRPRGSRKRWADRLPRRCLPMASVCPRALTSPTASWSG